MVEFQGTVLHQLLPFYQMSTGNPNTRPMMKRRRFIDHTSFSDDNDDEEYVGKARKRFASEEIMSSNMRNLCLTTPPHYTEYQIDESDWLDEPCDTSWSNHSVQDSLLEEDIDHPIVTAVTTPNNHEDLTPPASYQFDQHDNTVILEETNSDSSDDDNSVHVWIAPEMKTLMTSSIKPLNQSSQLLPDTIIDEISKPCQALVPVSDIHSIWKCQGSHVSNNDTNSSTDKDGIQSVMPPSPPVPLSIGTLNDGLPDYSEDEEDYVMEL